ncbi:MAG: acyl-CoA dehydrogenase, partial [Mucilaginibacter sp.]|nr:acyl-CoA dehydrogenase [Mucilaginibacter sp.]
MDFAFDQTTLDLRGRLEDFFETHILPAEEVFARQTEALENPWATPEVMEELKAKARAEGLWNLFLPDPEHGAGLTNLQYAPLCEVMGRSPFLAPEVFNCSAPDTGNMELLAQFGTTEQKRRYLEPLLDGRTRSAFSMTEPLVASSDATNIATRIRREADEYVISGRKWFTSGAMSPRCDLLIVMGVSDPDAERHRRQSMILVHPQTPGVDIRRSLHVLGYLDGAHGGHAEVFYDDVRVPLDSLLGTEGDG